ncbi:AraC family transcriptional regulator [Paenibacillus ginsengarvi]|uniref:AraC family transcriptional regulator n=1 Tax=Paenibacillus ginsengarvi TaxID=400777 RepID=A0A3B0AX92_9BACL|nr:AraC family transcriptional regulator [Paenibacillus ginsengarvi]RKN64447.1 AraC family transcriptional regulator [Paenibacillus ginsengarvi]
MREDLYGVTINPRPGAGEAVVLFAGNNRTPPLHRVGPHMLDYHLVHLVVSGQGSFSAGGRQYELRAGDCFFIAPGELAGYESDEADPWTYRWIGFRGTDVDYRLRELGIGPDTPVVEAAGSRRLRALFSRTQEALRSGKPGCDLQAGAYLRLFFAELADRRALAVALEGEGPAEAELNRRIGLAIRFLALQYHRPVSVEELARETGYHRAYLSRMFKKATGLSPAQYLLKLRMERAKALLSEPLTVAQIAASVGYADPFHFSKMFKKWHGSAPTELRGQTIGMERFQPRTR